MSRHIIRLAIWALLPFSVVGKNNLAPIGIAMGAEVEGAAGSSATTVPTAPVPSQSALVAPVAVPSGEVSMAAFWDTKQPGTQVAPQLRNAYLADYRDWPASLYVTFDTPDGRAACTAALIGPEAMLTAAHCVPANGRVSFTFSNAPPYITTCTQHPLYRMVRDPSADYALCKLPRPFTAPADIPNFMYDNVDLGPMSGRLDNPIVLTGFGCTSDMPGSGSPDGKYRYGTNVIVETSESPAKSRGPEFYSGTQDNNLFTGYDPNDPLNANICPGDSGGPAYRQTGQDISGRQIIGVNSRVFFTDQNRNRYGASLISSTGTTAFRNWALEWATLAQVQACGLVSPVTIRCRQ